MRQTKRCYRNRFKRVRELLEELNLNAIGRDKTTVEKSGIIIDLMNQLNL